MRRTRQRDSRARPNGRARQSGRRETGRDDLWLGGDEYDRLWTDSREGNGRAATRERAPRYLEPASRRSRRAARRRRRRAIGLARLGIAIALLAGLAYGAVVLVRSVAAPSLDATGPKDGAVLGPAALAKLTFSTKGTAADLSEQRWTLDGAPVTPRARGGQLVYRPGNLADGEHRFQIAASGGFFGEAKRAWTFTVDTTAPKLRLDRPAVAYAWRPVVVRGTVNEPATLRSNAKRVPVEDRRFRLRYATPPAGKVLLTATDAVGNSSRWRVPITLVPREPAAPVRSVHVSADAWASTTLRQGVLQMIEQGRINAVELDLKDEAGVIGWPADVPAAKRYGAIRNTFDLREAVRQLHAKGVRVIGRLVAFRDPILASGAWKAGQRDQVIQAPDGTQYAGYGGFTNFANPEVRRYNIAVAVEAAKAGVDDILYDYVRRPDGYIDTMVFPGLRGTAEKAIVDFLAETRRALRPYPDTFLGASVFGIAATRPLEIAQDIPAMARQVDYISPMVYPSHWAPGEYLVANPNAQPYDIVRRSVEDFARKLRGTGARLVPWLQDFSLGITYGTAEVAAQIRATTDAGLKEYILWDPTVTYTADAVPRTAKLPAVGTAKAQKLPADAPGLVALGSTSTAAAAPPQPAGGAGTGAGRGSAANPASVKANELGLVPVLMHHRVVQDRDSEYDLTPQEFRAELQRLWKGGFVPITAADFATGKIDVPAGKKPVVMTFDDGSPSQFALGPDGTVQPDTAVGIMLAFANKHPDFTPAGTFYVNADPFALGANVGRGLRWLMQHGFEIGNHSYSHANLSQLDEAGVQKELAQEARVIERAVPGYKIRTMALPFGAVPANKALAVRGRSAGIAYGPYAVMLVGANPAPSPFSDDFDAAAIPRIRSAQLPWRGLQENYAFDYWIKELEGNPGSVYVSDGNPGKISYPKSSSAGVAQRFQARANPY